MAEFSVRAPGGDGRLRQVAAWMGAAVVYGAAQGLSAWAARYAQGRGTRPPYEQFERPAFAPPGAVFPVVWSALNLTTATLAWLVWRAGEAGPGAPPRRAVLAWWRWPLSSVAVTCLWHSAVAASGRPLQTRRCCALSWHVMHPWAAGSIKPLPRWQFPRSRGPRSRPS
jgi:tryptophan-rich sensory protein